MWERILKSVGVIIGGIAIGIVIAFLFGWLVMLLWNWLMPAIFGLGTISFWQAWGLVILSHILFKGGMHGHKNTRPSPPWKKHFRTKVKDHLFSEDNEVKTAENG
jgi:hypothetical protein